jgi:hypothetical protein
MSGSSASSGMSAGSIGGMLAASKGGGGGGAPAAGAPPPPPAARGGGRRCFRRRRFRALDRGDVDRAREEGAPLLDVELRLDGLDFRRDRLEDVDLVKGGLRLVLRGLLHLERDDSAFREVVAEPDRREVAPAELLQHLLAVVLDLTDKDGVLAAAALALVPLEVAVGARLRPRRGDVRRAVVILLPAAAAAAWRATLRGGLCRRGGWAETRGRMREGAWGEQRLGGT